MKEWFSQGDENGNRGYVIEDLTPAELQAAWEITPIKLTHQSYYYDTQADIWLNYEGQPTFNVIPTREDADRVKNAVISRAVEIVKSGLFNPPTIDQIIDRIDSKMTR